MQDWKKNWLSGLNSLVLDDYVSFYAYFTAILTEIALLWAGYHEAAFPFTVLLVTNIVNVLVCAYFNGLYAGTPKEGVLAQVYTSISALIFVSGFFFDWSTNILLYVVPFIAAALWLIIRKFQNRSFPEERSEVITAFYDMFSNRGVRAVSQVIVLLAPLVVFGRSLWQIQLNELLKFLIIMMYGVTIPFISYIEGTFAKANVFELAVDDSEYER